MRESQGKVRFWNRAGFTLIELLIVVAIIAILAAIAVPNFLQAQIRSKISRSRADLRSLAVAIEAYQVDTNGYPPAYGVTVGGRDSWAVISTPVAYISNGRIEDPFAQRQEIEDRRLYAFEPINGDNVVLENPPRPPYSISPEGQKTRWWWLAGRGPDRGYGFKNPAWDPEAPILEKFYYSDTAPENWLTVVYDPTNGVNSLGNIYRAGGSVHGFAGKTMQSP